MLKCPGWWLMGSDQCSAWGYQGCLDWLWTIQDDLKNVKCCHKLLEWVWVSLGLTGRWTGGVVDMMLSLIALEVARISQYFQKGVTGHNTWPQWVTSPLWSNLCLKHWDPLASCSPIFTWSPAHRTFWSDKDTPPSLATLLLAQTSCLCQGLLQILYYLFPCQTHAP